MEPVTTVLDPARAEAFAGRMIELLQGASLVTLASIGHQTGLFDTLAELPPSTAGSIARAAGLQERYVREWLAAFVTAEIISYDPEPGLYFLPPEHAASLTRAAGPDNLAFLTQYFAVMGQVEGQVVESFRHGGGVPYSAYPAFQRLQAEETARVYDATLIQQTLPLRPALVERLEAGIDVVDIGCGGGHAINLMARAFPRSRFLGLDFSEEGVGLGRAEAASLGLQNARFEVRDIATLDEVEAWDLVTAFDVIHDQAHPARVLENVARGLRPGGTFLMVDIAGHTDVADNIGNPLAPMLYTISVMHCMTVSLAQDGDGLGTMWGRERAIQMLTDAGLAVEEVVEVEGDLLNLYYFASRA